LSRLALCPKVWSEPKESLSFVSLSTARKKRKEKKMLLFTYLLSLSSLAHGNLLPNLDQMQYGFNILRGQTPAEQRKEGAQEKLFSFSGGSQVTLNGVSYTKPSELKDYSATFECFWQGVSNEVSWATSSESLSWQAESSSQGFDQTVTIGVSVPAGAAEVSGETTIRNALVFGNSRTSRESFSQRDYGRTYTYDANGARFLYMAEVDWDREISTNEWDSHFKSACSSLGSNPSDSALMGFFQEFGTHGLARAQFGQKCTASVFVREGKTMTEYTEFMQTDETAEKSLFWFSSSSSAQEGSSSETTNGDGFKYVTSDKHCIGSLKADSNCGSGLLGNGVEDRPGLNEVAYKPIWEMNVPGLQSGAKNKMKNLIERMFTAQANCGRSSCNGRGVCAAKLNVWNSKSSAQSAASNLANFWDTNEKCFCNEDRVGTTCESSRDVALSGPSFPSSYQNDWDGRLNVRKSEPLCGVRSEHSNSKQDRRFKIATCSILESDHQSASAEYQLFPTGLNERWQRYCPGNMVMTGMYSVYSGSAEDRVWRFYCREFKNTRVQNCAWDVSYVNQYNGPAAKNCRSGQVLQGVRSVHDDSPQDRRWKYKCCELAADNMQYRGTNENNVGWQNDLDEYLNYIAKVNGKYAAISGVGSYHGNGSQDRKFKFWSRLPTNNPSRPSARVLSVTDYDAFWMRACRTDELIVRWTSWHNNGKEDRRFKFYCAKFSGVKTGQCYWSDYYSSSGGYGGWTTSWDASFTYKCAQDFALAGVQSRHSNRRGDREFNFKCCRFLSETGHDVSLFEMKKEEAMRFASVLSLPLLGFVSWILIVALWKLSAARGKGKGKGSKAVANDGYGACKA